MRRRKKKSKIIAVTGIGLTIFAITFVAIFAHPFVSDIASIVGITKKVISQPDEILQQYMSYINDGKFAEMYVLLKAESQSSITKEDFISKNQNIYEGIEAKNLSITITEITEQDKTQTVVRYVTRMDTLAGELTFPNTAYFRTDDEGKYHLVWSTQLIFPKLGSDDKVNVTTLKADRGSILDRNGQMLAGKGVASAVGFVPGKMNKEKEADITQIASLLELSVEAINKKLNASYVKEDTFVPLKTIAKGQDELEAVLLEVKGIKIIDTPVRSYPLAEKASHLTGYIQNVTAEDLEKLAGQGYNANSVIGKSGLEKIYEDQLRDIDGYEIYIADSEGMKKETLAKLNEKNGSSITLTIDSWMQEMLYDQFVEDKSASVAMNPKTGEVLALVSTPAFDSNDFVLGFSTAKWETLNTDENKPLYNRFKATLVPGSCFKAIIGAIGVSTGKVLPNENYGHTGLSWQKDSSWGGYKVTTMKDYGDQVTLENALVYSDNIYFAKAALNIGPDTLLEQLINIGFDEKIPFEYNLYSSTFSNTGTFDSEIQLADSGYGQAQILVNPIHLASIYSAFVNDGSMVKPYLIYKYAPMAQYWKEQVFTKEAANIIRDNLIQVIERGSGKSAKIEGVTLAGKTGTAEIKQSKDDKEGTELGWFSVFTADENQEHPVLIITMVEDVKNRGGSHYVIEKLKLILEQR